MPSEPLTANPGASAAARSGAGTALVLALAVLVLARSAAAQQVGDRTPDAAAAARAALEGFEACDVVERRARASLIAASLAPDDLTLADALLDDRDAEVRATFVASLARPDLDSATRLHEPREPRAGGAITRAARIELLATIARMDPAPRVRGVARRALGDHDDAAAAEALGALARSAPPGEREHAVASLPTTSRSAAVVRALVREGLGLVPDGPRRARVAPEVLAVALELHGRLVADARLGSTGAGNRTPGMAAVPVSSRLSEAERAELLLALAHPHPLVQSAAARGFEALLERLAEHADVAAATAFLGELAEAGLDPRVAAYQSVRLALVPGADTARADAAYAQLADVLSSSVDDVAGGDSARIWAYRSAQLEACIALADGDTDRARRATARGTLVLEALLAERQDRGAERARRAHAEALVARGLVEVTALIIDLAAGAPPASEALVLRARDAHVMLLEAQVIAADVRGQALGGFDPLLEDELSPLRLAFQGRGFARFSVADMLALQTSLGQLLATVAPREFPGFQPFTEAAEGSPFATELVDPLLDPRRGPLYASIQEAHVEGAQRKLGMLEERVARERMRGSLVLPEELLRDTERAEILVRMAQRDLDDEEGAKLLELRVPSSLALRNASDLAGDGRSSDARIVAGRYRQDLERFGISRRWFYLGNERIVRALMQIGGAFTDEGRAVEADATLREAVERLEDVERQLTEQGATLDDLAEFRQLRASALVSLAVNANVRLADQAKALAYYEAAYALRQDEFMTTLLACYRARSGHADEARELLRRVRAGPGTWYNLACTHALLGDVEEALDFLELELRENHGSEGSRARQIEWARADPDLERLRGDPRFELLTDVNHWAARGK
jgi:tetratricopeptide (TPR) repeat protein